MISKYFVGMGSAAQESLQVPASPLLEKARELGLQLPLDLERLAIARGCDYYARDLPPRFPPLRETPLSNEELAIALLSRSLRPSAREIRLSAAILGADEIRAEQVVTLAIQEDCAGIVRYIAESGRRFEPKNPIWALLLELLPETEVDVNSLPHPTRFVEMTAIDRGRVGNFTRWIRPRQRLPA